MSKKKIKKTAKKSMTFVLEELKKKTNKLGKLQSDLEKEKDSIKTQLIQLMEKEARLEVQAEKEGFLLESIKPDFLTKVKKQDIAIESLQLHLESLQKLQETITDEFTCLKSKIEVFNYKKVFNLNQEMHEKLRRMEKVNLETEKNVLKAEEMLKAFEKNYLDFQTFKGKSNALEKSFGIYSEKFDSLNNKFDDSLKQKDLLTVKKRLDKMDEKMSGFARKKDIDKLKGKKKGWLF